MTTYISIGNSDDKLTQFEWMCYIGDVTKILADAGAKYHGDWYSLPTSMWQNACWCVEIPPILVPKVRDKLAKMAANYRQDTIAWAEAETDFIEAAP